MNQREDSFRRRLEREAEKRRRLEEKLKHALSQNTQEGHTTARVVVVGGPDYEVRGCSTLPLLLLLLWWWCVLVFVVFVFYDHSMLLVTILHLLPLLS